MIKIRKAGKEDLQLTFSLIKNLLIELGDEAKDLEKVNKLQNSQIDINNLETHLVFLAEDEETTVGIITLSECFAVYTGGNYGIINEMYVLPEYRSKNIGAMLLTKQKKLQRKKIGAELTLQLPLKKDGKEQNHFI